VGRGGDDGRGSDERTERERIAEARARQEEARARRQRRDYADAVHAPVLQALRDPGRVLEQDELDRLVRLVQEQGWDPWERRDPTRMAPDIGLEHHENHVLIGRKWPDGTTRGEYDASIRRVIGDRNTDIFLSRYEGGPRVTFHSRTLDSERGPHGEEYVVVDYTIEEARWTTAFQTRQPVERFMNRATRSDARWP
jgi:hypothetical protein